MDRIWAPWRIEYILSDKKENGCVFCNAIADSNDDKRLVVYRGELAFVIMNKYPYNAGHVMVVPNRHVSNPVDLSDQEQLEMFQLLNRSLKAIRSALKPEGFNMGMNLSRTAGAGIDDHLHIHIVPRWNGDTNFMPVIADTKVISEAIEETFIKIKKAFGEVE